MSRFLARFTAARSRRVRQSECRARMGATVPIICGAVAYGEDCHPELRNGNRFRGSSAELPSFDRLPSGTEAAVAMTPILSVRDLTIRFGNRTVIDHLNFEIYPDDNLAIVGPNGAGKTVLLRALLNLLPYEGVIEWNPDTKLGYVPQKIAANRHLPLKVNDLLASKARLLKLPAQHVRLVADRVGLTPQLLETSIGTVSGGQFQKALIAFALLGDPNALLFDEPTASLDELAEERIYELIRDLHRHHHLTVLLVSHELSVVYEFATKVLCLSRGKACFGPPREILTPETLESVYSGPLKFYRHHHDS